MFRPAADMPMARNKAIMTRSRSRGRRGAASPVPWEFRLYIAGQTPRSLAALATIRGICEELLLGKCRLEVIDLAQRPERAAEDQIVAVPTLVRRLPPPVRKLIGNLEDRLRVMGRLELSPH